MTENVVLEVDRSTPGTTRLVDSELGELAQGQVRLRVDRFAVTANTITYAVMGDMLGYWDFYPTGDPTWGRVPAMGWADVVESAHPDVATGSRHFGWFPMAHYVDLTVRPTADGLRDEGAHRQAHATTYRNFVATTRDPTYPASPERRRAGSPSADVGDAEDRHALLRGLFLTGFLADAFFADQDYLGAENVVILSASAKTAIGLAQRVAQRDLHLVGVTSAGNVDFVDKLGWYDEVITYDDVAALPVVLSVAVDISGNGGAVAALHERLGDRLAYSMVIGASHHDAPPAAVTAGPQREFFFAPTEVDRRVTEWGRDEYQSRTVEALEAFVTASSKWLDVERSTGPAAADATWQEVFAGGVPPRVGRIVSLHD